MVYAIKTAVNNLSAPEFRFDAQKTMYGGKLIAAGDTIYLLASETDGSHGLFARGVVSAASAVAKDPRLARQTPRVSVLVKRTALACRPLGRAELKTWTAWQDGRPETELHFKLYRQNTNKIVGLTAATGAWLERFFAA